MQQFETEPNQAPRKGRFELKKYNAVAFWSWNISVESCAICKNHLMQEKCIECENIEGNTTIECPPAWGTCSHGYHKHCIERWLKNKQTCPLDNKQWVYQEEKKG